MREGSTLGIPGSACTPARAASRHRLAYPWSASPIRLGFWRYGFVPKDFERSISRIFDRACFAACCFANCFAV